jgi:hypothetical protein
MPIYRGANIGSWRLSASRSLTHITSWSVTRLHNENKMSRREQECGAWLRIDGLKSSKAAWYGGHAP